MSTIRLLKLIESLEAPDKEEDKKQDFNNTVAEIKKIIYESKPTSVDLQRALTAIAIEQRLSPEQMLAKLNEWNEKISIQSHDELTGYSDYLAKKIEDYSIILDNVEIINNFIINLHAGVDLFVSSFDEKIAPVDAKSILESRIIACEEYKKTLNKKLDEIYGEEMADPLKMRRAGHPDKIQRINALGMTNKEFSDIFCKYEIVDELEKIAQQYKKEEPASPFFHAEILAQLDQKLAEYRHALCKFPDNSFVSFLRAWGGKVAMKMVNFVEALQQKFYSSPGAEFVEKIKLHAPGSKLYAAQHQMFGKRNDVTEAKVEEVVNKNGHKKP